MSKTEFYKNFIVEDVFTGKNTLCANRHMKLIWNCWGKIFTHRQNTLTSSAMPDLKLICEIFPSC